MNLNLVRSLSKCFDNCDDDNEARIILDAVANVTTNKNVKVDDDDFASQTMSQAFRIKKAVYPNEFGTSYNVSKIDLIKWVRTRTNWGLKEAKDFVEMLPLRF